MFLFTVPPIPAQEQPDTSRARPVVPAPSATGTKPARRKRPMMSTLPHAGLFLKSDMLVYIICERCQAFCFLHFFRSERVRLPIPPPSSPTVSQRSTSRRRDTSRDDDRPPRRRRRARSRSQRRERSRSPLSSHSSSSDRSHDQVRCSVTRSCYMFVFVTVFRLWTGTCPPASGFPEPVFKLEFPSPEITVTRFTSES